VKSIDLGVERADDVNVVGDADALTTLLANLVDNAIRYTPAGGRVDVLVEAQPVPRLTVRDDGPGVPSSARAGCSSVSCAAATRRRRAAGWTRHRAAHRHAPRCDRDARRRHRRPGLSVVVAFPAAKRS